MSRAVDKVFGHFLLLLVFELAVIIPAIVGGGIAYHGSWGFLSVLALGAFGLPWTIPVPYLIDHHQVFAPVTLLVAAPLANLLLRFLGYYLRVDEPSPH